MGRAATPGPHILAGKEGGLENWDMLLARAQLPTSPQPQACFHLVEPQHSPRNSFCKGGCGVVGWENGPSLYLPQASWSGIPVETSNIVPSPWKLTDVGVLEQAADAGLAFQLLMVCNTDAQVIQVRQEALPFRSPRGRGWGLGRTVEFHGKREESGFQRLWQVPPLFCLQSCSICRLLHCPSFMQPGWAPKSGPQGHLLQADPHTLYSSQAALVN